MMRNILILLVGLCPLCFGAVSAALADRATIVLVLEPQKSSGRNWDIGRGADPIICLKAGCYVSRGLGKKAKYYSGRRVFFPGIRAKACRNSLGCVYRNVALPDGEAYVQPVDLDGIEHDFLERRPITLDESCISVNSRIRCAKGVFAADYSMWVIPEEMAEAAGRKALDFALYKGLHDSKRAYIHSFLRDQRAKLPRTVHRFYRLLTGERLPWRCVRQTDLITEAFFVSEIERSDDRKAALLYRKLLDTRSIAEFAQFTEYQPAMFWRLHNAINLLTKYVSAKSVETMDTAEGIELIERNQKPVLRVGWATKSRARAVIDSCIQSRTF